MNLEIVYDEAYQADVLKWKKRQRYAKWKMAFKIVKYTFVGCLGLFIYSLASTPQPVSTVEQTVYQTAEDCNENEHWNKGLNNCVSNQTVKIGMTKQEVFSNLGKPDHISTTENKNSIRETLRYSDQTITLKNGRVVTIKK